MIEYMEDPIKNLIELSATEAEADTIITNHTGFSNVNEKLAYLKGMFGYLIVGRQDGSNDTSQTDYQAVLSAIINSKWRV